MTDHANSSEASDSASAVARVDREPRVVVSDEAVTVSVRRAPKFAVFFVLGAVVGILVALILTFAIPAPDQGSPNTGMVYSPTQVFGFLALICGTAGLVLGGVVALIFDRVLAGRSREVAADRESSHVVD